MKKLWALLLAFSMLCLAGCGMTKAEEATNTLVERFEAVKHLDSEIIDSMTGKVSEGLSAEVAADMIEDVGTALLSKFDYEILSSVENEDGTVTVTANITTLDMEPVVQNWIASIMAWAMANMEEVSNMSGEK